MNSSNEGTDISDDYDSDKDAEYKPPQKKPKNHISITIRGKKIDISCQPEASDSEPEFNEGLNNKSIDKKEKISSAVDRQLFPTQLNPEAHFTDYSQDRSLEHSIDHPDEVSIEPPIQISLETPREYLVDDPLDRPNNYVVESPVQHLVENEDIEPDIVVQKTKKKLSRKRTRNLKSWAQNIRKEKYDRGLEYVSSRKKLRPARKLVTKKDCLNRCYFKCATKIGEDDRKEMFSNYYKLDANEKRMFILNTTTKCTIERRRKGKIRKIQEKIIFMAIILF